jgi:hypothetical protein
VIPIAVAPADATHTSHHASEDRIDQSEKVFDRDRKKIRLIGVRVEKLVREDGRGVVPPAIALEAARRG